MKRIIALILCFNFLAEISFALIEDDFVNQTLDKNLFIKNKEYRLIEEYIPRTNKKIEVKNIILQNEDIPTHFKKEKVKAVQKSLLSDFEDNKIPIKVKIKTPYSTKFSKNGKLDEGDYLEFETVEDVEFKNKNYPKGTTLEARIETISQNQIYGVPSDIVIGNFELDNQLLEGEIKKQGANRALWVYPLSFGTSWFFGLGIALMFVRGGHAKIKPNEIYTLYFCK